MPALDGTGPMGMGPMTGGGRGWCNPYFYGAWLPRWRYPAFQPWGWRGIPYGMGTGFMSPYFAGFRAFPYYLRGPGRGLRRWWW
jgi:hypothetical protein